MRNENQLPVVIIGAGPVGLAAAAHLSLRNQPFFIYETGPQVGYNVRSWGHVSMFSPWKFNMDHACVEVLTRLEWNRPNDEEVPTGDELVEDYLRPLAETPEIKPYLRLATRVVGISRHRMSKMRSSGRNGAPFTLHVERDGRTETQLARAVIDASGTWQHPNPIGANGLMAIGEEEVADGIYYGIPNIHGRDKNRYFNKSIAVIGGGHSAINVLLDLADIQEESSAMNFHWILTKAEIADAYGGLENDELPGRGQLGQRVKSLVESSGVQVHTPFFVDQVLEQGSKLCIHGTSVGGPYQVVVDEVIAATGLRPDLTLLRELRTQLDPSLECPTRLAEMIDPNLHSCGTVVPHGEAELRHPEKDFYIVGMKSYGRAPTFLLATGYEQVRSVVAALCEDWTAAREVRLKLPETEVCGVPAAVDSNHLDTRPAPDNTCCASQ